MAPLARPPRSNRVATRRGMTIVIALIFLFVAAILGFALEYAGRAQRGLVLHSYEGEVAIQACRSAIRAARTHYAARLNDPGDPLHALLRGATGPFPLPDFKPAEHAGLKSLAADFRGLTIAVSATVRDLSPLTGADLAVAEKRGDLELVAHAAWRNGHRAESVAYPFKFVDISAAPFSRFTLFVRAANDANFNLLDAASDGAVTGGAPVVLANGPGADPAENGWIYFGGGRVNLNLARGESNFGEDFHLPETITRSLFFPSPGYALLHVNIGFYKGAADEPSFNRFPLKTAFKTSVFRLFGCPSAGAEPTPTLVLGDVWRRYVQAAAAGPLQDGKVVAVAGLPWLPDEGGLPDDPAVPPFLLLSFKLYQVYMSQIREEPYNRSFDYIVSGAASPPPLALKSRIGAEFGNPYPCDAPAFTLRTPKGETLFTGPLREASLDATLAPKVGRVFDTFAELVEALTDGPEGHVRLAGVCRVNAAKTDLAIYRPLVFTGRGAILFAGPVRLGDIELADPARDLAVLACERGDVTVRGQSIAAGVIAWAGTVKPEHRFTLRGFLAMNTIDPALWRQGGRIDYDRRYDPSAPGSERPLAFVLGDRAAGVVEE